MASGHFLLGSHNFMVTALDSCVKWPYDGTIRYQSNITRYTMDLIQCVQQYNRTCLEQYGWDRGVGIESERLLNQAVSYTRPFGTLGPGAKFELRRLLNQTVLFQTGCIVLIIDPQCSMNITLNFIMCHVYIFFNTLHSH